MGLFQKPASTPEEVERGRPLGLPPEEVGAIPMKRTLITPERLNFPSGTAAAVTLQVLYSRGSEALRKARTLMYAALAAGVTPILMDLKLRGGAGLVPAESSIFDLLPARRVNPPTRAPFAPS